MSQQMFQSIWQSILTMLTHNKTAMCMCADRLLAVIPSESDPKETDAA